MPYAHLVGLEVEVTEGLYKGRRGVIASVNTIDPVRNTPEIMIDFGEKHRESRKPILYPFGFGLNKIEYLKPVNDREADQESEKRIA